MRRAAPTKGRPFRVVLMYPLSFEQDINLAEQLLDREWLGQIAARASAPDAFLVTLSGIGRDRKDRDARSIRVALDFPDQQVVLCDEHFGRYLRNLH